MNRRGNRRRYWSVTAPVVRKYIDTRPHARGVHNSNLWRDPKGSTVLPGFVTPLLLACVAVALLVWATHPSQTRLALSTFCVGLAVTGGVGFIYAFVAPTLPRRVFVRYALFSLAVGLGGSLVAWLALSVPVWLAFGALGAGFLLVFGGK